jgi:putative phage-type endonuclease
MEGAMALTEAQVELHRTGLGGSDGAAILGVHPYRSALDVYLEKRGLKPAFEGNRFTRWGHRLEAAVADAYAEETGREVFLPEDAAFASGVIQEHGVVRHPDHPYIIGFPDRLVFDKEKGPGVLECKTTALWHAKEWDEASPIHHQIQLQHYLLLTGYQWGSVAVLIGGNDPRFEDLSANPTFQAVYVQRLVDFYEHHLQPGVPPEPDPEKDAENLRFAYRAVAGSIVDLGPDAEELAGRYELLKEQIKALEAEKKQLETALKVQIGSHEMARFPSGWGYSWKECQREGYMVAPATVRTLRKLKKL